jgi:hypothetical protein
LISTPLRSQRTLGLGLLLILLAPMAFAQDPHDPAAKVPDVPTGTARIRGVLKHPAGNERGAGSSIVLYALAPDGSPGLRSDTANERGEFVFEGISNAAGIVYMVGARFGEVPYGERVRFQPDQSEIEIVIEIADPSRDGSQLRMGESSLRLDWIGTNLAVEEVHQIINPGTRVILIPMSERTSPASAPFRGELPAGATHLDVNASGLADGFSQEGSRLGFWGPIYPGEQPLRYRYLLPMPVDGATLSWPLPSGSSGATLIFPGDGPQLSGADFSPGGEEATGERVFKRLRHGPTVPGQSLAFEVSLPETRNDASAIHLPRASVWVERDDTFQQITVELNLTVEPGAHLAGRIGEPLLRFEIPEGAELRGLSDSAQTLGLIPNEKANLDLLGPLSPGEAMISFRYRVPIGSEASKLELVFPSAVDELNVLIADTGLVIDTEQLNRRRPFKSGTRFYLHRQAYRVPAGVPVRATLTPIDRSGVTRRGSLIAATAIAAVGIWFVFAPLSANRGRRRARAPEALERSEREMIYDSIRDLDLDFETGKLDSKEHQLMREELRARAIGLLQQERDAAARAEEGSKAGSKPKAGPSPVAGSAVEVRPGAVGYCPACGAAAETQWRFCVQCGDALPSPDELPGNGEA